MAVRRIINSIEYTIEYDRHREKYIVSENGVKLDEFDNYSKACKYLDAYLKTMR